MLSIFSTEELTAMDRLPVPATDLDLISLGDEIAWEKSDVDLSGLECQPLLVSDLPPNSELRATEPAVQS